MGMFNVTKAGGEGLTATKCNCLWGACDNCYPPDTAKLEARAEYTKMYRAARQVPPKNTREVYSCGCPNGSCYECDPEC